VEGLEEFILATSNAALNSSITDLGEGKAYALHNMMPLDGRVSAYPKSARGFAPSNCYLLVEESGAILLDTGFNGHRRSLFEQIGSIITSDTPLSIFPLRQNEFMSVGNVAALAKEFNVVECFSQGREDMDFWFDFELEEFGPKKEEDKLFPTTILGAELQCHVGGNTSRPIIGINAPIRLISTMWIYDEGTRTLFSSDMFSHVWQDNPEGPWLVVDDDKVTTSAFVSSFLLNTRYWWIEGIDTTTIRAGIADVFDRCDIETLAPGYGTILRGRELVERQFSVLDEVLRDMDRSVVKSRYIPRDMER
jgi:hypothetical protein